MLVDHAGQKEIVQGMHDGEGGGALCFLFEGQLDLPVFVHHTTIFPESSIGVHHHADSEEIYWVLEGEGVMTVDDEDRAVGAGDVVLTKSGSSHGLRNAGDTDLRLVVIGGKVK